MTEATITTIKDAANTRSLANDLDAYVSQLNRMLATTRRLIVDTENLHRSKQADLIAQLSDLDTDHRRRIDHLTSVLNKLEAMQHA